MQIMNELIATANQVLMYILVGIMGSLVFMYAVAIVCMYYETILTVGGIGLAGYIGYMYPGTLVILPLIGGLMYLDDYIGWNPHNLSNEETRKDLYGNTVLLSLTIFAVGMGFA